MKLEDKKTLEDILKGSPQEKLLINKEDREWIDLKPVGKEKIDFDE